MDKETRNSIYNKYLGNKKCLVVSISSVYVAGSQSGADWPSAPASRSVKYSGASEPAHGLAQDVLYHALIFNKST